MAGTELDDRTSERARIAEWLHAKANETELLLKLAAERGDPANRSTQLWFAKKTRILLYVLATMIEQNALALKSAEQDDEAKS